MPRSTIENENGGTIAVCETSDHGNGGTRVTTYEAHDGLLGVSVGSKVDDRIVYSDGSEYKVVREGNFLTGDLVEKVKK